MSGTFLSMLNDFIVNVATPAIRADLNAGFSEIQLIIGGYVLVYGLLLVLAGRLGDIHGQRRLFLTGSALFSVASLACGLAPNPPAPVVCRIVQAIGAALLYPQVLSILQISFTGKHRATAFAVYGTTISLASVAGQLIGGVLVAADLFGLGWRAVFLVNVPIGLVGLADHHAGAVRARAGRVPRLRAAPHQAGAVRARAAVAVPHPHVQRGQRHRIDLLRRQRRPVLPPAATPAERPRPLGVVRRSDVHPAGPGLRSRFDACPRLQQRVGYHVLSIGYAVNVFGNVLLLAVAFAAGAGMSGGCRPHPCSSWASA